MKAENKKTKWLLKDTDRQTEIKSTFCLRVFGYKFTPYKQKIKQPRNGTRTNIRFTYTNKRDLIQLGVGGEAKKNTIKLEGC